MESLAILDSLLYHVRQEAKNLGKKYTSAYLSRLMKREGLRNILWNPYQIWRRSYAIEQDPTGNLWNLNKFWKMSYSLIDKIILNLTGS